MAQSIAIVRSSSALSTFCFSCISCFYKLSISAETMSSIVFYFALRALSDCMRSSWTRVSDLLVKLFRINLSKCSSKTAPFSLKNSSALVKSTFLKALMFIGGEVSTFSDARLELAVR